MAAQGELSTPVARAKASPARRDAGPWRLGRRRARGGAVKPWRFFRGRDGSVPNAAAAPTREPRNDRHSHGACKRTPAHPFHARPFAGRRTCAGSPVVRERPRPLLEKSAALPGPRQNRPSQRIEATGSSGRQAPASCGQNRGREAARCGKTGGHPNRIEAALRVKMQILLTSRERGSGWAWQAGAPTQGHVPLLKLRWRELPQKGEEIQRAATSGASRCADASSSLVHAGFSFMCLFVLPCLTIWPPSEPSFIITSNALFVWQAIPSDKATPTHPKTDRRALQRKLGTTRSIPGACALVRQPYRHRGASRAYRFQSSFAENAPAKEFFSTGRFEHPRGYAQDCASWHDKARSRGTFVFQIQGRREAIGSSARFHCERSKMPGVPRKHDVGIREDMISTSQTCREPFCSSAIGSTRAGRRNRSRI